MAYAYYMNQLHQNKNRCIPFLSANIKFWRKDWELHVKEVVHGPGVGSFDESLLLEEDVLNCDRLLWNHNRLILRRNIRL